MSIITSLIIIIIAMLIQAFLQLVPGTFSLFYHYASAKHSVKTTDSLSLSFILGVESFTTIIWLIVYSLTFFIFHDQSDFNNHIFTWIMAGIFVAEAFAFFLFYFRKGKNCALFISRNTAENIEKRTKKIKNRSDAFTLGFTIGSLELIFTIPLYIISVVELMYLPTTMRIVTIILFVIITTIPLFYILGLFHSGRNLAEITRSRVRSKSFIRSVISFCFLMLAFTIITFGVF